MSIFRVICEKEPPIQLLITNQRLGFLKPCGCSSPQLGGFSKLATFVKMFKANYKNTYLLSNGDISPNQSIISYHKMKCAIQCMNQIDYDLMNIGELDIQWEDFETNAWVNQSNFKWISLNASYLNHSNNFESYVKLTPKINVVGFISPLLKNNINQNFKISNPSEILNDFYKTIDEKEKNKFWIVMFHGEDKELSKISIPFKFYLSILSHHGSDYFVDHINNHSWIYPGNKGQGVVQILIEAEQLNISDMNYLELDESYPNNQEIDHILNQYSQQVKDDQLSIMDANLFSHEQGQFVGVESCKKCHEQEYTVWKNSKHSGAFDVIKDSLNAYNPECIQCHTTGYHYTSGFESYETTKPLANVSCESCHGAGSDHIRDPENFKWIQIPDKNTCLKCHDPDNSPHFLYEKYFSKIKH